MSRPISAKRGRKNPFQSNLTQLRFESLEERALMSANAISGFVYYDANQNGTFDTGESPIANSQIELHDANNVVVGTTTTDAQGNYSFTQDQSTPTVDETLTKTVTFPSTQTNFQLQGVLDQFDPSLGQLQSIEIQHAGSITSEIQVENVSADSDSTISGTVAGTLNLTGPGGVNDTLNISGYAGSFQAGQYDGTTDFTGTSGTSFGQKTANGTNTITLTGDALTPYIGTGQVNLTENAVATSNATGGGNLDVRVRSTGDSTVTVIYHYKAYGPLQPGNYTIVQTSEPPGYTDGLESNSNGVIPNTIGTDTIPVTLQGTDVPNNNFGELKLTSISGFVYSDANNDGIMQSTEAPITGTQIELDGPGGPLTTTTDATGFYHFDSLAPGTYTVKETQPANYLDGKDAAGTKGGTVVNDPTTDQIQGITLQTGDSSENNDFGELQPSSLEGHVFQDLNNNGKFDTNEPPIPGTTITLSGFDDNGPVNLTATTDANGEYKFTNLRPGTYALTETQPAGYTNGLDTVGTQGGTLGNDVISAINLAAGVDGANNDFGELKSDQPGDPGTKDVDPLGMLPAISKAQLTARPTASNIDPVLRSQMTFVVGTQMTLLGVQPNLTQTLAGVQQMQAAGGAAAYVQALWTSDAHLTQEATSAYQSVLNRAPTSQELTDAVQSLKTGSTTMDLEENLLTSTEFGAMHPTSEDLATALYQKILNTTPGTQSLAATVQSMGNQTLQDVVHGMLTSPDALASQIDDAYLMTVRRPATDSEIQTWSAQIQAGTLTVDDLAQRLLASSEFQQLAYNNIV